MSQCRPEDRALATTPTLSPDLDEVTASQATTPECFEQLTRFEVQRLVAEGGMGRVYEAIQHGAEGFRKRVAIKVISGNPPPAERDRFVAEAKLAANLIHYHIVQIYQLGLSPDSSFFIVMEYIDGCTLKAFMRRHRDRAPLDIQLCCFIVSRVCRALEYAHKARNEHGDALGVVHRDITPSNVMINTEGVVKLTDFGIAKARLVKEDGAEGTRVEGTPGYMSPEQARGAPTDRRSDLFSLGSVFFELLTGQPLFRGEDPWTVRQAVLEQAIPAVRELRSDVPDEVNAILSRALMRDMGKRYLDAGTMGQDLEQVMYSKGYGPTNETLETYLREVFPEITLPPLEVPLEDGTRVLTSRPA